jgi:succinate dehydrogenase / fumarate reductase flavoprotein subunit
MLKGTDTVTELTAAARRRMSDAGAAIRETAKMQAARAETLALLQNFENAVGVSSPDALWRAYRLHDILLTQNAVLFAMLDFAETIGKTRGSALYTDKGGTLREGLDDIFRFTTDDAKADTVQEIYFTDDRCAANWRSVRPLPQSDDFFENVWRGYRENGNIY